MKTPKNQNFKLSDTTIAQIAKLVQVAILSGTDVVDNLRQLELTMDKKTGKLNPTEEYEAIFNANVEAMISKTKVEQLKLF